MSEEKQLSQLLRAIENDNAAEIQQIISSSAPDVINKKFTTGGSFPQAYVPVTYAIEGEKHRLYARY